MITPLRRRHRWMAPGAFGLGIVVLAAAIAARPGAFVAGAGAPEGFASGAPTAVADARTITLAPEGDDLGPDLLVYGVLESLERAANEKALPEGAVLLGPKRAGAESVFTVDGSFATLAIYSLGHGEVKAWVELEGPAGGAR